MVIRKARSIARDLALAVAVMVLVLGSSAVTALEDELASKDLFSESSLPAALDRTGELGVVRSRAVQPDLALLLDADGTPRDLAVENRLTLNLFADVELVAVLDRVEPSYGGGFTWVGQVQDEPVSAVTLVVNEGMMAGTVVSPQGMFRIGYAGNGMHAVYEVDPSAFPPEAEPIPVEQPEGKAADAVPAAVADDGSVIDVMVVYTPAARNAVGGGPAMTNLINLAVTETNQSYANSGITQRLSLVYTTEVSYTTSGDFYTDLYRLRLTGDGYMDNVHPLRDSYHADEVVLIINNTQYCGMAYLMQTVSTLFQEYAFAVVHWDCATGYYSFGHELGHNMGAQHDLYVATQGSGAYWYSHGYVNTIEKWRTVMAYNTACDSEYCARIPFWSSPSAYYAGDPTGTYIEDNHRTLNNTAWTVANFRVRPPSAPTGLIATAVPLWQINLSWADQSNNEDGFRIERSLNNVNWSTIATVAANTIGYPDTSATPGTLYYYRVIAYNTAGDSAPSNTASATLPEVVGPLVYNGYAIDDDNLFGTSGNDNGLAECGETVGLTVMLKNEGNSAAESIDSTLSFLDTTYPVDIGNTDSDYPDIAGGASAGNVDAFEFSAEEETPSTPFAHWIDIKLAVTANDWSGPINFSLPIVCPDKAAYRFYLTLIFKN